MKDFGNKKLIQCNTGDKYLLNQKLLIFNDQKMNINIKLKRNLSDKGVKLNKTKGKQNRTKEICNICILSLIDRTGNMKNTENNLKSQKNIINKRRKVKIHLFQKQKTPKSIKNQYCKQYQKLKSRSRSITPTKKSISFKNHSSKTPRNKQSIEIHKVNLPNINSVIQLCNYDNKQSFRYQQGIKFCKKKKEKNEQPQYYMKSLKKSLNSPYSIDYFQQIFREHYLQSYSNVIQINDVKIIQNYKDKVKNLKKSQKYHNMKTLVLDLDQTLVHCLQQKGKSDVQLEMEFPNGQIISASINIRPYCKQFLQQMCQHFQIIAFTASHQAYAQKVLQYIDPQDIYFSHKLFRQSCVLTDQGFYIKDLRIINRQLQDLILVDNAVYSFSLNLQNGVPIIPFYEQKSDNQLKQLRKFLMVLKKEKDVRSYLRKYFKLHLYNPETNPQQIFIKHYKQ